MMPQRKSTVSAPSRNTPVKAIRPTIHSRWVTCAWSMRCWISPLMPRACCCIHQACHVSRTTARKITPAPIRSGPRSSSGPERKPTATPMATLAASPSALPSVTHRKFSRAPILSRYV